MTFACFGAAAFLGPFHALDALGDNGKAPIGVALVIGNGSYESWPNIDACHFDGVAVAHALEDMGYTVILVEDASKAELKKAIERFRTTLVTVLNPTRYAAHQADDPDFNPWQNEFSPGLKEKEVCAFVFYSGHSTQFTEEISTNLGTPSPENYIVPTDASLNPTIDECTAVKNLFIRKLEDLPSDIEYNGRVRTGLSIVVIDAGHAVASGPFVEGRDSFRCPITTDWIRDPVYLVSEPQGWRYSRSALERVISRNSGSPYTGNPLPTLEDGQSHIVADEEMKADMEEFISRSTLVPMDAPDENSIVIFAEEPNTFSADPVIDPTSDTGRKRGLFTDEFLKLIHERDNIINFTTKLHAMVYTRSNGIQVPWSNVNLREDAQLFSLSGKFPVSRRTDQIELNEENVEKGEEQEEALVNIHALAFSDADLEIQNGQRVYGKSVYPGEEQGCFRFWFLKTKATVLIVIGFGQVIMGMGFAFDIPFPIVFKTIIQQFKLVSIDILGVIRLGCIMDWDYMSGFYAQMLIIPAITLVILGAAKFRDTRLAMQGEAPAGTLVSAEFPHGGAVRQGLWAMALEMIFTLLIFLYPVVSNTVFQSFLCTTLHEGQSTEELMFADFQIECGTPEHRNLLVLASFCVIVYPIGVPLLIFGIVFLHRKDLAVDGSFWRMLLAPVVGMFKPEYWYWNPLDFFRKVILTGLMMFFKRGSMLQLVLGTNIAAFFLVIGIVCEPFGKRINNMLYHATNAAILFTFTISILLNPALGAAPSMAFITIALILAVLGVPVACMVEEIGRLNAHGVESGPARKTIDGLPWPFARWTTDEQGNKRFQGSKPGDTVEFALLCRELEKIDTDVLFSSAKNIGVSQAAYDSADHAVAEDRRYRILEFILEIARREGTGWGPFREPEGIVRRAYVEREINLAKKRERELREHMQEEEERSVAARFKAAGQYDKFKERTAKKEKDRVAAQLRESTRFSPKSSTGLSFKFENPLDESVDMSPGDTPTASDDYPFEDSSKE